MMKVIDLPKKDDLFEMTKALIGLAKMNKTYYDSLIKEGFTEAQALELIKSFKWV